MTFKGCFVSMCFAGVVFYGSCLNSWTRKLLDEIGLSFIIEKPAIYLADNKPVNILSKEDILTSGNQYIYLPYHFNKEVQEMGFSEVAYVPTLKNISDLFTKAVDSGTIRRLVPSLK